MKKGFCLLLCVLLSLSVCACAEVATVQLDVWNDEMEMVDVIQPGWVYQVLEEAQPGQGSAAMQRWLKTYRLQKVCYTDDVEVEHTGWIISGYVPQQADQPRWFSGRLRGDDPLPGRGGGVPVRPRRRQRLRKKNALFAAFLSNRAFCCFHLQKNAVYYSWTWAAKLSGNARRRRQGRKMLLIADAGMPASKMGKEESHAVFLCAVAASHWFLRLFECQKEEETWQRNGWALWAW